jgi:hypothetical protein
MVSAARSHGRRQSVAEARATRDGFRPAGAAVVVTMRRVAYPVISVQAVTHFWNGTQSLLPLPHCGSGVFQNSIVLK